jgi:hypothetical protein
MMELEELLRMTVKGKNAVTQETVNYPPEFVIKVQDVRDAGVRVIVHADGHNSETLDYLVTGNTLKPLR